MIIIVMFGATLIYLLYAWICYNPAIKDHTWGTWLGISCAIAANALWLYIAKTTLEPRRLLTYAMFWDVIVTGTSIAIPIWLFNVRMHLQGWAGMLLIIGGLYLLKTQP
jgi:hypothetical protein